MRVKKEPLKVQELLKFLMDHPVLPRETSLSRNTGQNVYSPSPSAFMVVGGWRLPVQHSKTKKIKNKHVWSANGHSANIKYRRFHNFVTWTCRVISCTTELIK